MGDAPTPQPSAGTIEQTFATVPGQLYVFSGWMAHNPGIPGPPEGRANVTVNGQPFVQLVHHDAAATTSDMRRVQFAYRFRATAATTTLAIADVTYAWDKGGLALDNLSVTLADPNLLVNGSFEAPDTSSSPFPWGYAYGPTTDPSFPCYRGPSIPGWRITRGTIDVLSRFWPAADGRQSIDLVGSPGAATIEQSFPTEPGREYLFSGTSPITLASHLGTQMFY